jgi:hypothetical protein
MPNSRGRRSKQQMTSRQKEQKSRLRRGLGFLGTPIGWLLQAITYALVFYGVWQAYADTFPRVTPQATESSSSTLHFKVEDPSILFDMRKATISCQLMAIDIGPLGAGETAEIVQSKIPGRTMTTEQYLTLSHWHPKDFPCGTETLIQVNRIGGSDGLESAEIEIIIDYEILGMKWETTSAGPFTARKGGDGRYNWTEGETVAAEPIH